MNINKDILQINKDIMEMNRNIITKQINNENSFSSNNKTKNSNEFTKAKMFDNSEKENRGPKKVNIEQKHVVKQSLQNKNFQVWCEREQLE